jgi:hypothetical protein
VLMPHPTDFRDDVVRVARNRAPGVTVERIAERSGLHPMMLLQKGLRRADIDGASSLVSRGPRRRRSVSSASGSGGSSRRTRPSVTRRHSCRWRVCRERWYPLVTELAAAGIRVTVTCRVLKLSGQPDYRWLARSHHPERGGGGVSPERAVRRAS